MNSYDYIIIGAGTAGCIIAAKLLEKTNATVLLLEAGIPNHEPIYHVSPALSNYASEMLPRFIQAGTILLPVSTEKNGSRILGKIGCIWGGSSTVNRSLFVLPSMLDFHNWEAHTGLPASVFVEISKDIYSNYFHSHHSTDIVMNQDLIKACEASNISYIEDNNLIKKECVTWAQLLHRIDNSRFSTADLLQPHLSNPRLTILSQTNVKKVIFEGSTAKSVECAVRGTKKNFQCNKGIICSAGTFGSALVLQNSGIAAQGAISHLPGVGMNLREHFCMPLLYTNIQTAHYQNQPNPGPSLAEALHIFLSGSTYTIQGRLLLFLKSFPHLEYPDVYAEVNCTDNSVSIIPILLCEFSSGMVSQNSHCYNPFTHPFDLARMRRTVRMIDKIMNSFRENTFQGSTSNMPDEQLDQYIRTNNVCWTHPVGTCAMGYTPQSVVDEQLRVHHVNQLYVADCSVIPIGIHGGPLAGAICIGEYASKTIINHYNETPNQKRQSIVSTKWQIAGCQNLCSRVAIGLSHCKHTPDDFAFLDQAVAHGYTTFDCAVNYPGTIPFGAWLKTQSNETRARLFIIAKGAHPADAECLISRMNWDSIFSDVQYLLKALETKYLDCFMLHRDDETVPIETIVQWMNHIVNAGWARSYGVSNWTLRRIKQANDYAYAMGLLPIGLVSNYCGPLRWLQPPWPLCVQMDSEEIKIVTENLGIPILSWSPIALLQTMPKDHPTIQKLQSGEGGLIPSAIRTLFNLGPKVGVIIRTTSFAHLSEIISIEFS